MKRLFLSAAMLLCMCIGAMAQPRVIWDGPAGLDVKFKRCYVQGSRCIIDFTITNNTGKNIEFIMSSGWSGYGPSAYDDEGNNYKFAWGGGNIDNVQSTLGGQMFNSHTPLPADITIKAHIVITDIDEYASALTLYRQYFDIYFTRDKHIDQVKLEFKNIPIQRE